MSNSPARIDPLFVIFEQHLCNHLGNQPISEDRKTLVEATFRDYLEFLRNTGIAVPKPFYRSVVEELERQVGLMITQRLYGHFSITAFRKGLPIETRKQAFARYRKLGIR